MFAVFVVFIGACSARVDSIVDLSFCCFCFFVVVVAVFMVVDFAVVLCSITSMVDKAS